MYKHSVSPQDFVACYPHALLNTSISVCASNPLETEVSHPLDPLKVPCTLAGTTVPGTNCWKEIGFIPRNQRFWSISPYLTTVSSCYSSYGFHPITWTFFLVVCFRPPAGDTIKLTTTSTAAGYPSFFLGCLSKHVFSSTRGLEALDEVPVVAVGSRQATLASAISRSWCTFCNFGFSPNFPISCCPSRPDFSLTKSCSFAVC